MYHAEGYVQSFCAITGNLVKKKRERERSTAVNAQKTKGKLKLLACLWLVFYFQMDCKFIKSVHLLYTIASVTYTIHSHVCQF